MKNFILVCLLSSSIVLASTDSRTLGFATGVKSDGMSLSLHGVGTRKATLFAVKVYHAAFYATKNLKSLDAVLSDPDPKRLELKYLRNFGLEDTQEAWVYQFRESSGLKLEELEPSLGKLISMQTPIREGDVHRFDFNGGKVTFYINGESRGEIENEVFRKALLTIFFGSNPPTKELQRGLYEGIESL